MKTYRYSLLAITIFLFVLIGCSDYGNELQYVKYGSIEVKITDAPFPEDLVSEANVTITKVDARFKDGVDDNATSKENHFQTIFEGEMTVNLLELRNGVTESMGAVEVPVGTYDLLRVYVKDGSVVLKDETVYDLKVPSGSQSGIKVFIKPSLEVIGELTSEVLLDFDVSKSFVPKGNPNSANGITGFNFKPVVRASNMSFAGTLSGTVTTLVDQNSTSLEGAQIGIIAADTIYTTTFTDASGMYTILGVDAGSYTVTVDLEGYEAATVEEVSIVAGNKTVQDFELISQ